MRQQDNRRHKDQIVEILIMVTNSNMLKILLLIVLDLTVKSSVSQLNEKYLSSIRRHHLMTSFNRFFYNLLTITIDSKRDRGDNANKEAKIKHQSISNNSSDLEINNNEKNTKNISRHKRF